MIALRPEVNYQCHPSASPSSLPTNVPPTPLLLVLPHAHLAECAYSCHFSVFAVALCVIELPPSTAAPHCLVMHLRACSATAWRLCRCSLYYTLSSPSGSLFCNAPIAMAGRWWRRFTRHEKAGAEGRLPATCAALLASLACPAAAAAIGSSPPFISQGWITLAVC